MKIVCKLSIGFVGAEQEEEVDLDEWFGEGSEPTEEEIYKALDEWAANYIDIWYEKVE